MTKTVPFGRRGAARPVAAPAQAFAPDAFAAQAFAAQASGNQTLAEAVLPGVALTPEQRAFLFGADAPAEPEATEARRRDAAGWPHSSPAPPSRLWFQR